MAGMEGKWCLVIDGGCTWTAKYKHCISSAAAGVIFMASEDSQATFQDHSADIWLHTDELSEIASGSHANVPDQDGVFLIPVIYLPYDAAVTTATHLKVGPNVQGRTRPGFNASDGGIRVYDYLAQQWYSHADVFRTQEWMQHSGVRNVLFVCTDDGRVLAMDTTDPRASVKVLGGPTDSQCKASDRFRDYHIVDLKRGDMYITVLVDPGGQENLLRFYDTTDLQAWQQLHDLEVSWEHDRGGLGQVVPTADARFLLVTWHCSTIWCRDNVVSDAPADAGGARVGERLYILYLEPLFTSHSRPEVIQIIPMNMTEGTMIRDVACSSDDLCLVSLTWDGIVAVDLREGPYQFQIVARHTADFQMAEAPSSSVDAYLKLMAGAQKVYASPSDNRVFYVESWNMDFECYKAHGQRSREYDCLRYDHLHRVVVDGYHRNGHAGAFSLARAARLLVRLLISHPYTDFMQITVIGVDAVWQEVRAALALALVATEERFQLDKISSVNSGSDIAIDFWIEPSASLPSAAGLLQSLQSQLSVKESRIFYGPLAGYLQNGAYAERKYGEGHAHFSSSSEVLHLTNSNESSAVVLVIAGLSAILTAWSVALAWRQKQLAGKAMTLLTSALSTEPPTQGVNGSTVVFPAAGAPPGAAGQPLMPQQLGARMPESDMPDAPAADMAYVVGKPVGGGGGNAMAAAAAGAVHGAARGQHQTAGTPLTEEDLEKMGVHGPSGS